MTDQIQLVVLEPSRELRHRNPARFVHDFIDKKITENSIMRWSYLIPRVVIMLLAWAFFAFLFDPLMRVSMISTGQMVAEAKVDIHNVQTKLYPPALEINQVQIANRKKPGVNLLQFDQFRFRLRGNALLRKRFIVEEGTITGLRFGTDRVDSGLLEKFPVEEKSNPKNRFGLLSGKAKALGTEWIDELLQRAKMQTSFNQFESIRLAKFKEREWNARFAIYKKRLMQLKLTVKQIEQRTKNGQGNFLEKMENYQVAAQEMQQVLEESNRMRAEFPLLSQIAQRDFVELDAAKKRDQEKIQQKLNLFKTDGKELTDMLLSSELANRLQKTTAWFQWSKQKYAGMQQVKPERARGVDIFFPLENNAPRLLIKKLSLSGELQLGNEVLPFRGVAQGITSESQLYGKPMVLDINAQGKSQFRLHSEIDYRTSQPVHRLQLAYIIPSMKEMELGDPDKFGLAISAGQTEWIADIKLTGKQLSGTVKLTQSPVVVVTKMNSVTSSDVSKMLEEAIAGIEQIETTIELGGTLNRPQWKLKSNLGEQIATGISRAMTLKLKQQQQKLAQKLDSEYFKKTNRLRQLMTKEFAVVTSKLKLNDQFAQNQIKKLTQQNPNLRQAGRQLNFKKLFRR
ncbi:hypothetical protein MNBD_PLANCTO02-1207 [hydrothermal vent metagenome]|uniref:TIGR03545 family protein n=2 Tax=hydrothermal vent metagenome TaxID=652676 RepID=A0A3B1DR16_9ZZZZ